MQLPVGKTVIHFVIECLSVSLPILFWVKSNNFDAIELHNEGKMLSIHEFSNLVTCYFDSLRICDIFSDDKNPDKIDGRYSDLNAANYSKFYGYEEVERVFENCISDFKIIAHNTLSVSKIFDELNNEMSDFNFHVIALSGTRMSNDKFQLFQTKTIMKVCSLIETHPEAKSVTISLTILLIAV